MESDEPENPQGRGVMVEVFARDIYKNGIELRTGEKPTALPKMGDRSCIVIWQSTRV